VRVFDSKRSIPACAGLPRLAAGEAAPRRVYPRVCGATPASLRHTGWLHCRKMAAEMRKSNRNRKSPPTARGQRRSAAAGSRLFPESLPSIIQKSPPRSSRGRRDGSAILTSELSLRGNEDASVRLHRWINAVWAAGTTERSGRPSPVPSHHLLNGLLAQRLPLREAWQGTTARLGCLRA